MKLYIAIVTLLAFCTVHGSAFDRSEGTILIGCRNNWALELFSDGSALLIRGSGMPNSISVHPGVFEFSTLCRTLPAKFVEEKSSGSKEFVYSIAIYPPHASKAPPMEGFCSAETIEPMLRTVLRIGEAAEVFWHTLEFYPLFGK